MSADKNVFDNPLSADETDDASLGTPSFESGTPSFELDGRGSAISKASSSPTQKARSVFGSRPAADVENPLVERLGDMTTEQVIGLFKSLDLDGNGMIDVEEMVVLMGLLGKPADEESVLDMMQTMGAKSDEGVELGVSHPLSARFGSPPGHAAVIARHLLQHRRYSCAWMVVRRSSWVGGRRRAGSRMDGRMDGIMGMQGRAMHQNEWELN